MSFFVIGAHSANKVKKKIKDHGEIQKKTQKTYDELVILSCALWS